MDAKIPVLTAALEAMTLKPKGDENAGSTATFSSSKDAKDPRGALAGEVLLARWVPDLRDPAVDPSGDPSSRNPDDELDDSIARKQAGDLLRGGGEKDDGEASAEARDVSLSAGVAYAARALFSPSPAATVAAGVPNLSHRCQDFLADDECWTCDILFANSTAFSAELIADVERKCASLKRGAVVVTRRRRHATGVQV